MEEDKKNQLTLDLDKLKIHIMISKITSKRIIKKDITVKIVEEKTEYSTTPKAGKKAE